MSKNKRELTPEETKLWRRVAATVKSRRAAGEGAKPSDLSSAAPPSRANRAPDPQPPRARTPEAPPPNRAGEKRVRRGKLEIGGALDLHGHSLQSGRAALTKFLQAAHARGDRAVIVVTGMGRAGQGVLRRSLPEWLAQSDLRPLTSGYAQAHRAHGGAGAFYVFIKRVR